MNKKSLGAIVATALLIVVSVLAVIGYQTWFQTYSSSILVNIESNSDSSPNDILLGITNENIYLKSNESLNSIIINDIGGNEVCFFSNNSLSNVGLVGWWKFNDEDSIIKDLSGNGNDGKLYGNTILLMNFDDGTANDKTSYENNGTINGPTWQNSDCISGGCFDFDGEDDYIEVNLSSSLDFTNETKGFTLSAWAKVVEDSNTAYPADLYVIFNQKYYFSFRDTDNKINFNYYDNLTGWLPVVNSYSINQWYYVTAVYEVINFTNSKIKLYVDGNLKDEEIKQVTNFSFDNLYIGSEKGIRRFFNGTLDELAVYSKALNESEVEELYGARKAKFIEFKNSPLDKAVEFDGIDDYIIVNASSGDFEIESNLTVYNSFKVNSLSSEKQRIITRYLGTWGTIYSNNDYYYLFVDTTDDGGNWDHIQYNYYNFGDWISFVHTYNGSKITIRSLNYSNSKSQTQKLDLAGSYRGMFFGSTNQKMEFLNGSIDEIRIFDRVLSSSEIEALLEYSSIVNGGNFNYLNINNCNLIENNKYELMIVTPNGVSSSYFIAK